MEAAIVKAACAIGAGIAMGFGAIGPAVGEGKRPAYQHDSGLRHHRVDRHLLAGYRAAAALRVLMKLPEMEE